MNAAPYAPLELDPQGPSANQAWAMCPACGGNNLHHYYVSIYGGLCRGGAGETTNHGCVHGESEGAEMPNPSSVNDAVGIRFWCETCPQISELCISQHKGLTLMGWRRVGERPTDGGEEEALECTEWIADLAEPMTASEIAAWGTALRARSTLLTTDELRVVATVRALLKDAEDREERIE